MSVVASHLPQGMGFTSVRPGLTVFNQTISDHIGKHTMVSIYRVNDKAINKWIYKSISHLSAINLTDGSPGIFNKILRL